MDERSERLELVATVLLGIATAASAWCTYESQLWDGEQLRYLSSASRFQSESLRATEVTTRNTILDATTFAAVVAAETHGDERLSRTLTDVARPAFRTALKDWQAKRSGSSVPEGTPFDDASYREAAVATSRDLGTRADAGFASASAANANSDRFAMRAVLFALALFFLGIAGQLRARSARRLAVAMGALVLLSTLLSLTRLERAPRPERVSASDEPRRG